MLMENERTRNLVGVQVRRIRKEKGIKQCELAAALNSLGLSFTTSTLSKIEVGSRAVTDREVAAFAIALQVDISRLFSK